MKNQVICKVCGYIMEEGSVHDVCPACGVSAKAFEPYKSRVSEKRSKILALHLHPIILHFPQAAVTFALLLLLLSLVTGGALHDNLVIAAQFNVLILPLSVLGGFASGLLDGKIRFKSVMRPILKLKIVLSCVFFALSIIAAVVIVAVPLTQTILLLETALILASTALAIILGHIGGDLINAVYPG